MTEIRFHHLASEEVRRAQRWYLRRNPAVADRFLQSVEEAVLRVSADPESHPIERKNYRFVRVRRFPYLLIFHLNARGALVIIAAPHAKRRPGYWSRRKFEGL